MPGPPAAPSGKDEAEVVQGDGDLGVLGPIGRLLGHQVLLVMGLVRGED
jgi:hypothetical protein